MISWIGELFRLRSEVERQTGTSVRLEVTGGQFIVTVRDGKLLSKPEVFVLERESNPSKENKEKYDRLLEHLRNLKRA